MAPLDHPNGSVEIAPNLTQLWGADNTDTGQSRVQFWSVNLCVVLNALAPFNHALFFRNFNKTKLLYYLSMQSWDCEQIAQSRCATGWTSFQVPTFIFGAVGALPWPLATSLWTKVKGKQCSSAWSWFFGCPTAQADNGRGDYLANADQNVADYPIHPDLPELSIW